MGGLETKLCTTCRLEKSVTEFSSRQLTGYVSSSCRACHRVDTASWRDRNPERSRVSQFRGHLKRAYKLSLDEYEALCSRQGGMCAICQRPPKIGKRLCVDHCHVTGRVRGLLCVRCNGALGALGDTTQGLERAVAYLRGGL